MLRMNVMLETADTDRLPEDFETFFVDHRDGLFGALWLVTRDRHEAEDLAQDAFLKVWERWDRVGSMDDPTGYLYRTGMNLLRNRRRRALLAVKRAVHLAAADEWIDAVDERDAVMRALGSLTRGQRTALVLTDLLQMTSEEAGRILGVRPSTVRVLAARGRNTLRERMGDDDA
jgi:RNA polymerase sigma-70 factor (ECF subfamily)